MTDPTQSSAPQSPAPAGQGLEPNIAAMLAYLLFGWIGGLIMFLTQKHREVRFHGMQSIVFSAALAVLFIALGIVGSIFAFVPGLDIVAGLVSLVLYPLLWLGAVAVWILLCVKGYQLAHFKLPVIGDYAEQWSGYHK